jgi:hypothetical protein
LVHEGTFVVNDARDERCDDALTVRGSKHCAARTGAGALFLPLSPSRYACCSIRAEQSL